MKVFWTTLPFSALTTDALYDILRLRQEVFVVEQTCYYLDADGRDRAAHHLCGHTPDGRLAAYARLLDRGVAYPDYASIGRVITAPFARGRGLARPLMRRATYELWVAFGRQPIKLSAQAHLQDYYGSVGFVGEGPVYDEDGIPHRAMVLTEVARGLLKADAHP